MENGHAFCRSLFISLFMIASCNSSTNITTDNFDEVLIFRLDANWKFHLGLEAEKSTNAIVSLELMVYIAFALFMALATV